MADRGAFRREQDYLIPNEGEMRAYHPSLFERIGDGIDAVGGAFGYPDLAERTGETLDLVSLPSLLAIPAAPAAAATRGMMTAPTWDASIAKVLQRKYPFEPSATSKNLTSPHAVGDIIARADAGTEGMAGVGFRPVPASAKEMPMAADAAVKRAAGFVAPPPQWNNPFYRINDGGAALSPDKQKYLNELLAQQSRGAFKAVGP